MSTPSNDTQYSLLRFKLLVSDYQKYLLKEENKILLDEVEFLADTEVQLREQLHQQFKGHQLQINHFDSLLK